MRRILGAFVLSGALLSACSASTPVATPATTTKPSLTTTTPTTTPVPTTTTTTLPTPPSGWTLASVGPRGITALTKTVVGSAGAHITVAEFPAATTAFHLHVGTTDPPGATSISPNDAGASVSAYELSLLIAAFNGGFKKADAKGGVMVDGTVVSPLVTGAASAVIDANGSLHVGSWGVTIPTTKERVTSVRQNLTLLVSGGKVEPTAANPALWGSTIGSNPAVARSALGVDASGNVFFLGSMAALPLELAQTMATLGVSQGMQLDINPNWITLGISMFPGGQLMGEVPGQQHSPSIFIGGWQRDFLAVLALPPRNCRLVFPAPPMVAAANPPTVVCGSPGIQPRSSR